MRVESFFAKLPGLYYGWGSIFAYPRNAEPFCHVLETVQAMTTPSTMLMLNTAVSCMDEGECYLEVGPWRGATFIGALQGNPSVQGYAIDDDSMDEHDGDKKPSALVWSENVERFGVAGRSYYIAGHIPEVWSALPTLPPVGVYLFDGDKATPEAAFDGLEGVIPFLADTAMLILDDANQPQIRMAAMEFIRRHPYEAITLMDMPTPGNCWPGFWDGFLILGWSRAKGNVM